MSYLQNLLDIHFYIISINAKKLKKTFYIAFYSIIV